VFAEITRNAVDEATAVSPRTAIPYELANRGIRVVFKDIWTHGEEDSGDFGQS
jgi:hypothetical protein